jgi:hypothetical protein
MKKANAVASGGMRQGRVIPLAGWGRQNLICKSPYNLSNSTSQQA